MGEELTLEDLREKYVDVCAERARRKVIRYDYLWESSYDLAVAAFDEINLGLDADSEDILDLVGNVALYVFNRRLERIVDREREAASFLFDDFDFLSLKNLESFFSFPESVEFLYEEDKQILREGPKENWIGEDCVLSLGLFGNSLDASLYFDNL